MATAAPAPVDAERPMDLAHIFHLGLGATLLGSLVDMTVATSLFLMVRRRRAARAAVRARV